MEKKIVMFAVQGEGRGHMTQAIAMLGMMKKLNFEVCCVMIGGSSRREAPEYFKKKIDVPLVTLDSPNFVTGTSNKSIRIGKTILKNILKLGNYKRSIGIIHKLVKFHKPDIIINFYEPLIGLYGLFHNPACKVISVAHQYIYLHPAFRFPTGNWIQKQALIQYTRLTAIWSDILLAISQYDLPESGKKNLVVIPPILRNELFQQDVHDENFILVYLLNSGFMNDILDWHKRYPAVRVHCFTDSKKVKEKFSGEWVVDERLSFHSLSDNRFLEMMANCSAIASTAGFESVCEAMYLGKPIMMVPVPGHFEQYCNASDVHLKGAGIHSRQFKLEKLIDHMFFYRQKNDSFRHWVDKSEEMVLRAMQSLFSAEKIVEDQSNISILQQVY
jgi:uncharacterized protein (TIGR00661 family)